MHLPAAANERRGKASASSADRRGRSAPDPAPEPRADRVTREQSSRNGRGSTIPITTRFEYQPRGGSLTSGAREDFTLSLLLSLKLQISIGS